MDERHSSLFANVISRNSRPGAQEPRLVLRRILADNSARLPALDAEALNRLELAGDEVGVSGQLAAQGAEISGAGARGEGEAGALVQDEVLLRRPYRVDDGVAVRGLGWWVLGEQAGEYQWHGSTSNS